jgi:hypothetical protein
MKSKLTLAQVQQLKALARTNYSQYDKLAKALGMTSQEAGKFLSVC